MTKTRTLPCGIRALSVVRFSMCHSQVLADWGRANHGNMASSQNQTVSLGRRDHLTTTLQTLSAPNPGAGDLQRQLLKFSPLKASNLSTNSQHQRACISESNIPHTVPAATSSAMFEGET